MRKRSWFVVGVLTLAVLFGAWLARGATPDKGGLALDDREAIEIMTHGSEVAALRGTGSGSIEPAVQAPEPRISDPTETPETSTVTKDLRLIALQDSNAVEELRTTLERLPHGVLGGRVIRREKPGEFVPVSDAEALLWASEQPPRTGLDIPVNEPPTLVRPVADDGTFEFDRLEPGGYLLGVRLDDGASRMLWKRIVIPAEPPEEDKRPQRVLIAVADATVQGSVYGPDGRPRVGVRVRVSVNAPWDRRRRAQPIMVETLTDTRGMYVVEGLSVGAAWVSLPGAPRGERGRSQQVALVAGETSTCDFGSPEGLVRFHGQLVYPDGAVVRAASSLSLRSSPATRKVEDFARFKVDEEGRFDTLVRAGAYMLHVHLHGPAYLETLGDITVSLEDVAPRRLELPALRIEGAVGKSRVPMRYVRVWPKGTRWQASKGFDVVRDGRYELAGYEPGTYLIRAESKIDISAEAMEVTIREDDKVVVVDLPAPQE